MDYIPERPKKSQTKRALESGPMENMSDMEEEDRLGLGNGNVKTHE